MKLNVKYLLPTLLFSFVFSVAFAASNEAAKPKTDKAPKTITKIRIGWVYAMANAPVLIAKEKGYFKEQGIEVELHAYTSGPRVKAGLQSGKLDLAYIGAPPDYHWYSRGLKREIIAKVNYGQAAVIVRKDSGITTLSGLRGKKMAGVKIGSGMDVLLRGYVLQDHGKLNPRKDVDIRPMKPGNMGAAVENKLVSGAFVWEPFTSKYLARGNTRIILDVNKQLPKYPWYVIMAMPKALKEKREVIIKVLKAHKQAVAFLNSSPTAGNAIIAKAFNLKTITDRNGVQHTANDILTSARKRLGWQADLTSKDTAFIQRLMNYSFKLGYIKVKMSATDLIDNSLLKAAGK